LATKVSTQSELYELIKSIVEAGAGDLTDFSDGSMHDILAGAFTTGMNEISELIISEFKKTYFETSHGIEITGDVDDLQNLAIDHYGDDFKRPEANQATGSVDFTRPTSGAGNVIIAAGTVVKTEKDVSGQEILFSTDEEVTLTGLTISANITATVAGVAGNVDPCKIIVIETTLTDPTVTVSNPAKLAGGTDEQDDAEYRETIRNLIKSLAGATKAAVEGAILSVSGVNFVTLVEKERVVIDYDIAGDQIEPGAAFFRIPYPFAYIADENGQSSQSLIDDVNEALETVRACGVGIDVQGASAVLLSWDAAWSLNAGGPNFATLQSDPMLILDTMKEYIDSLDIREGFSLSDANDYIFAIWGPSGTNDVTSFNTNTPVSNVEVQSTEKLVPNVMSNNGVTC